MARERSPARKKAMSMWFASDKQLKPSEIAEKLGISAGMVRKWKSLDKWEEQPEPRPGAPKGNQNAKGNKGGPGGPVGNDKAVTHGFFRKFFPDDALEIMQHVGEKSPLDMLWDQITIQYAAIIRAQHIMHVTGKDEMVKELKKQKFEVHSKGKGEKKELIPVVVEEEHEFQFSWDRHATYLKAQSQAMATLQGMIKQYEAMCRQGYADEEQQLRLTKLKLEVKDLRGDSDGDAHEQGSGYAEALNAQAADVFADEVDHGEEA
jgi:phage terminase small subunit